jgi:hypothetical protein
MKFKLSGKEVVKNHSAIFEETFDEWCANDENSSIEKLIECNRLYQKWKTDRDESESTVLPPEIYDALMGCTSVRVFLDTDHSELLKGLGVPENVEIIAEDVKILDIELDSTTDLTQPNVGLIPNIGRVDCVLNIPISMTETQIQEELKGEMFTTLYHNAFLHIGGWLPKEVGPYQ